MSRASEIKVKSAIREISVPMPLASQTLSDALLFATLCIVGLPVEVQVKDGSIYSGIFHTADMSFGVVLKKARKISERKNGTNLTLGAFVDTLVVLSEDLVQVVVKDFLFPLEGKIGENSLASDSKLDSNEQTGSLPNANKTDPTKVNSTRDVTVPSKSTEMAVDQQNVTSQKRVSSCSTILPHERNNTLANTGIKESKLNPSAKVFAPSIAKLRPPTRVIPSVINPNYVVNNTFPSHLSMTNKTIPCINNLPIGNTCIAAPYTQPVRVGGMYQPVPVRPACLNPNSQPIMAGRTSPVLFVRPIPSPPPPPRNTVQIAPIVSQGWARGSWNPYQTNVHKFQGSAPVCVAPPVIPSANPALVVPANVPFVQNLPTVRPIVVHAGTGFYPSKFQ